MRSFGAGCLTAKFVARRDTHSGAQRCRVTIANRADGGIAYWLVKLYAFSFVVGAVVLALVAVLTYDYYAAHTPRTPKLGQ